MALLTLDDVIAELTAAAGKNRAEWCREHKIAPSNVHDVLHGRREPGEKILDALGLYPVPRYRRKNPNG